MSMVSTLALVALVAAAFLLCVAKGSMRAVLYLVALGAIVVFVYTSGVLHQ